MPNTARAATLLAAVLTLLGFAATSLAATTPPAQSSQWFSATSVWRKPLSTVTAKSADSARLVASLTAEVSGPSVPWINSSSYSTPIYTVGKYERTVKVTLTVPYAPLQDAWLHVPLPVDARPAAGTDAQLVVWQPATDTMWEFWQLKRSADGRWSARWGGVMTDVSKNPGYFSGSESTWGATATSLPLLGGLITINDLRRGTINHALAIAVPNTAAGCYTFPAQRTDGDDDAAGAIPEGTRFRLPASLNLQAMNLPPVTLELAEAAQRYGIIVRDTSANVSFYAQAPPTGEPDPYVGFWGTAKYPSTLLKAFPWSQLQVVSSPLKGHC